MKQSDIFSIIFVASVGIVGAFFLCQTLMGDPKQAKVEFLSLREVIGDKLVSPDPEIFNSTAINPTIEVYVGECEDTDRNGILDNAELEACNKKEDNTEQEPEVVTPEVSGDDED